MHLNTKFKVMFYDALAPDTAIAVRNRSKQILDDSTLYNPWDKSNNDSTFNFDKENINASDSEVSPVVLMFNESKLKNFIKNIYVEQDEDTYVGTSGLNVWLNRYNKNMHWQEPHNHSNDYKRFSEKFRWRHASFVYYVQVDESNPCFYFYDGKNKTYIYEKNNSMVVFPQNATHGVDINTSEIQRITMAGNISFATVKL